MTPNIEVIRGLAKINPGLFDNISKQANKVFNYGEGPYNITEYYHESNMIGVAVATRTNTKCYTTRELKDVIIKHKVESRKVA